jgi:uncharacterized membrane protein
MDFFFDLKNSMVEGYSLAPAANTNANTNGAGVDLVNGEGRTQVQIAAGTMLANTVIYVQMEESSDNTTFTTPADTTNTNTGNLNTSNTITRLSFQRGKRYVRGKLTISGTSAGLQVGIIVAEQKKDVGNAAGFVI